MKIDFSKKLVNYEGKEEEVLASICKLALFAGQKDGHVELKKAEHCWALLSKIKPETVDVSAEDVVLIKERVAAIYPAPGIVGQVSYMLNQEVK